MRRDQLEHAIRTACQIIGRTEVIVVGSQSILGTFREDDLPIDATMSIEIDILPIADDIDETARLADLIEGVAGEFSPFEELTASASTASTWRHRHSRRVGATAWSRCRTPTPPHHPGSHSSPAGALTRRISESRNYVPSASRTATSSPSCCKPGCSIPR